jgi:hypothetical protein
MGKGWTEIRRLQRKHGPDTKGRINHANLTAGLAIEGSRIAFLRMRVFLKSPVLENGTPESVRGRWVTGVPTAMAHLSKKEAWMRSPFFHTIIVAISR